MADLVYDAEGSAEMAKKLGGRATMAEHFPDRSHTRYRMEDVRALGDGKAHSLVFFVDCDFFDGTEALSIFTDDGMGNGNEVFTVDMVDLEEAIRKSNVRRNGAA